MFQLLLLIFYCGLRKGVWTFRFSGGNPPSQILENVLLRMGFDGLMGWDGWTGYPYFVGI